MEKVLLYQMDSLYRDSFKIYGYHFGGNEKTVCIVDAIRGNEIQQLYMCSNLIKTLKLLEERRCLDENLGIMIVPSVNPYSLNTSTRFWATDNTDINRMFPGYENVEVAKEFAMPYIMLRNPKPYDTTTLNYEWQVWGTQAFSIYTPGTDQVDVKQARYGIDAVIRFLAYHGLIHMKVNRGYRSRIVEENELVTVRTKTSGILVLKVKCGDHLSVGDEIAEIIDTYEGDVIEVIKSPCEGCLFYHGSNPLIYSNTAIAKIIKDTDFI